ncbi:MULTISPECIES: caspase family protein [unclassified Bradyrhizobium]|uniref:caspase family protein n=1 Tax=unclassified Bradyrhizobium TaxID=2631580 RepID=UPI002479D3AA|nr:MULTISPECIES: caspase family protein [unclassified Bradyrhizobium]WGR71588.1 caspase family protein [Bradyrhizobium sp. ISRA426]WGR76423.1 caspase family protein [Bradyrhizobium sp. ISRA430]WGR86828.1 caspase family protein [Bradyrhizobium sp. ISRA432]
MRLLQFLAFCFLLLALSALDAHADKRVALVIGNGAYRNVPALTNPTNDAADVGAALKRAGFEPLVATDLDQAAMQDTVLRFAREARGADVALFYYSGHALQFAGVNYLVPVDAVVRDEVDLRRLVRADEILADLQQAKNLRILVLDACRDNPFADELRRNVGQGRGVTVARGLAKMESPDGTIISYATQAGRTADDGDGRNSPYTSAFLEHIRDRDNINTVFQTISAGVYQRTKGSQVPELSLSFFGEYYLNGKPETAALAPSAPPQSDPCADAGDHWRSAEALGTLAAFKDHLVRFPACAFADLAKSRIAALTKSADDVKRSAAFDGTWIGKETCESKPPFPEGYYQYALRIKDGVLHAVFGDEGKPGSSVYDGRIEADGSASITVNGLFGENDPLRRPAGSPYQYKIVLALKEASGAGVRTETARPCRMELSKLAPQGPNANPAQTDPKRATKRDDKTAVVSPEQREGGKARQTGGGLSCSAMRSRCAVACVSLGGRADCASTACPRLEAECMSSGCWYGRGFSGCGLARR